MQQNVELVVHVAQEYRERLGAGKIIDLLENRGCYDGLYCFLKTIIDSSQDPEVCFVGPALSAGWKMAPHCMHVKSSDCSNFKRMYRLFGWKGWSCPCIDS